MPEAFEAPPPPVVSSLLELTEVIDKCEKEAQIIEKPSILPSLKSEQLHGLLSYVTKND